MAKVFPIDGSACTQELMLINVLMVCFKDKLFPIEYLLSDILEFEALLPFHFGTFPCFGDDLLAPVSKLDIGRNGRRLLP